MQAFDPASRGVLFLSFHLLPFQAIEGGQDGRWCIIPSVNLGPLIIGIEGTVLDVATRERLCHPAVGGVILFSRNYENPGQLARLSEEIRALRTPRLLIQVDQEGGRVQRFQEGFTRLPPLAVLGQWHESRPDRARDLAYRHGRVMAAEVLAHGVDQSLAPVLDLDGASCVIGDRAMSAEPETVADLGRHYLAGMRDAGMAACGKHFPGHGSVAPDTHVESAVDDRDCNALEADLGPFRALAHQLPAIMMAHVCYPVVDERPAGFSPVWIRTILRGELEYSGAVISDDLDMAAACACGDLRTRLKSALEAGCDLALVCRPESAAALLDEMKDSPRETDELIKKLYGKPQFTLEEQLTVPEFLAWRESLEALNR